MSSSFLSASSCASRLGILLRYFLRDFARALPYSGRNALLLMLAQLFLRIELPAAMLTLEDFHGVLLSDAPRPARPEPRDGPRRCYFVFGAVPLSFSASSTVTLS